MVFVTKRICESSDEDFFVRAKISKFYKNFYDLRPNKKSSAEDFFIRTRIYFVRPKKFLFGRRFFCSLRTILLQKFFVHMIKIYRPLAQSLSARYRCGRSGVRFPGRSNRHSVANDSPPLRRFFGAVLPRR